SPLDHRDQITGRSAELHDAADQLEVDAIAESLSEELAESCGGAVVDGGGLLVAAEFDDHFRGRVVGHERLCYITKRDGCGGSDLDAALVRTGYTPVRP